MGCIHCKYRSVNQSVFQIYKKARREPRPQPIILFLSLFNCFGRSRGAKNPLGFYGFLDVHQAGIPISGAKTRAGSYTSEKTTPFAVFRCSTFTAGIFHIRTMASCPVCFHFACAGRSTLDNLVDEFISRPKIQLFYTKHLK